MYVADMAIVTDLIDYRFAGEDAMMYGETPDDVVNKYCDSITRVKSTSDIVSTVPDINHAELVIEDNVAPEAIESVYR